MTDTRGCVATDENPVRCVPPPDCTEFPPAGPDLLDTLAVVSVEIPALALMDSVQLRGPSIIERGDPYTNADGFRKIDTEIVSMDLDGTSPVLGQLRLVQSSSHPSLGMI